MFNCVIVRIHPDFVVGFNVFQTASRVFYLTCPLDTFRANSRTLHRRFYQFKVRTVLYIVPTIEIKWGEMSAAAVMALVPVFIFALLVQRRLVQGLTGGAVKG